MRTVLLMLGLVLACAAQVLGNAAPFPPRSTKELPNPGEWLAMRHERVHCVLTGASSTVDARFHFEATRGSRLSSFFLRMGFPRLRDQQPMEGFQVRQMVYPIGAPEGALDAVAVSPVGPVPAAAEVLPALSWLTWEVPLPARPRGDHRNAVDVEVTYTQALTAQRKPDVYQFRYVLRSGAPWARRIGASEVVVDLQDQRLVSASPAGHARRANRLVWQWKDWEPKTDVVVVVKAPKRR